MSRYRKIDPRIWNDAKFNSLTDDAKLAFFMLLTHPGMTALGAMRATVPGLAAEMKWTPEAFGEAFGEACSKGMAEHDESACLIALPNFLRYNPPESPNVVKAWVGAIDLLPECRLKTIVLQRAGAFAGGMSEAFGKAFAEAFPKAMANQEQEKEQEQEKSLSSSLRSELPAAGVAGSGAAQAVDLGQKRAEKAKQLEQRLAQVTDEAVAAYNSALAKPTGLLVAVHPTIGREKRQQQVKRCITLARQIAKDRYGSDHIPAEFWADYFAECARDPFRNGTGPYKPPHEGWRPDFEFLTRSDEMLKVFDRASSDEAAEVG
ncbi:hypothetical protein [Pseudoxanthomonas indica]|uniref:Uncharacterized protein n=1 Tax=Pseudoxanthomonas indica TaxID=428993 RepID=A0A1T5JDC1_9GAMM|nr:hypothetical protein [Pseudoxanthomonas indica]GGD57993.1 hypothetical protein GCM10007235_32830 [Pseudoxanthomonas indica]SKC49282.1 hypothetical protein SAMN06296058_0707 [Pseudoxanthomonas indica]